MPSKGKAKSNVKEVQKPATRGRSAIKDNQEDSNPKKKTLPTDIRNDPQPKKKKHEAQKEAVLKADTSKEDSPQNPPPKKGKAKTEKPKSPQKATTPDPESKPPITDVKVSQQPDKSELKKVIMKGSAPVDQFFSKPTLFKVYSDGQSIYSATLNQSNIQANNNKFYILQILQSEAKPDHIIFFTRWGRVGVQGQQSEEVLGVDRAKRQYRKKLNDKLKTYRLVEMNYEQGEKAEKIQKEPVAKKQQPVSTLPGKVQELVRLMFDMRMMASQMKEIGYDAKKMPLGKLAKASIVKGYEILKRLMDEIKGKCRLDTLSGLSGEFYSEIPHDFGFKKMSNFVLKSEQLVKEKLEMLQSLEDIQIFTKLIDEGSTDSDVNELDSNYAKLNISIVPMDHSSDTYRLLEKYVKNTHASTHTAYKLEVLQIFQLEKQAELKRYRGDINNKQLLWHGSRLTNFVGILSQGLRIAPPEAPVTGYMFGKGVYFADMVTKSSNYCFASRENDVALMLLCEVALGAMNQKFYADYYANLLPEGKMSTKGCGKAAPKQGEMLGDVLVPCGQGAPTGIQNSSLLYNEYIVYDVSQIKCRYLFKMKFHYV